MNETKKLSGKTIFGYAFGSMADAASYNFIIMYMLYFLTAIIGLSAGKAVSYTHLDVYKRQVWSIAVIFSVKCRSIMKVMHKRKLFVWLR